MKKKLCTQCGQKKVIASFYKIKNSNNTSTIYRRPECKACCYTYRKTSKGTEELNRYRHSPKGRFVYLKAAAKRRNILCLLTLSEFENIIGQPCFYCKDFFAPDLTCGCGLDRLDSSKGYLIDNVVSCCGVCNSLKLDKFSVQETLAAVQAIIHVRENSNTLSLVP